MRDFLKDQQNKFKTFDDNLQSYINDAESVASSDKSNDFTIDHMIDIRNQEEIDELYTNNTKSNGLAPPFPEQKKLSLEFKNIYIKVDVFIDFLKTSLNILRYRSFSIKQTPLMKCIDKFYKKTFLLTKKKQKTKYFFFVFFLFLVG